MYAVHKTSKNVSQSQCTLQILFQSTPVWTIALYLNRSVIMLMATFSDIITPPLKLSHPTAAPKVTVNVVYCIALYL